MTTCSSSATLSSSDALERLRAAGVDVGMDGDRLVFRPARKVPPDLVPVLQERKAEIIEALSRTAPAHDGPAGPPQRTPRDEVARTLAGMEPNSPEEAAYVRQLEGEAWTRRELVELLNRDTERRWRR